MKLVISSKPRPFSTQGKSPRYPLNERLYGPQSRSRQGGEENPLPPCCPYWAGRNNYLDRGFLGHEILYSVPRVVRLIQVLHISLMIIWRGHVVGELFYCAT